MMKTMMMMMIWFLLLMPIMIKFAVSRHCHFVRWWNESSVFAVGDEDYSSTHLMDSDFKFLSLNRNGSSASPTRKRAKGQFFRANHYTTLMLFKGHHRVMKKYQVPPQYTGTLIVWDGVEYLGNLVRMRDVLVEMAGLLINSKCHYYFSFFIYFFKIVMLKNI